MFEQSEKDNVVTIKVSITKKEWENEIEMAYERNKHRYAVTGFRPGHAPKKVIEKNYGDDVFYDSAVSAVIAKAMQDYASKNETKPPIERPKVSDLRIDDDGLNFTLTFEIEPEIKLCKYTGLTFKKMPVEVTEGDIQMEIDALLEDNSKYEAVDRASKDGDQVLIDFNGSVDGKEIEGGRAENYPLTLGSHMFIPGFEEQLVGKKKGDKVKVEVKFPSEYVKEYADKDAIFDVLVKEVREKNVPTLDDKFISNATEFETVEEYKKKVIENIQNRKKNFAESSLKNDILAYIVDNSPFKAPEFIVQNCVRSDLDEIETAAKGLGLTSDEYFERLGMTRKDFIHSSAAHADAGVRIRYIIKKLVEELNIKLTNEEIEATKAKLRVNLPDSNDLEELAVLNAEREKVFEYLLAHNTIVEEEPEKSVKEKESKAKKVEKKEEEKKADKKEPKKTTKKN